MFIFTAKLNKSRLIAILSAAAALILFIIFLANRGTGTSFETTAATKLPTTESHVAYLQSNGYNVMPEPVRMQEVLIPETFSDIYTQYNKMQLSQGFDLEKYQGRRVMQYVYQLTPQGEQSPTYATLLLYKNKLIGADLSRGGEDSFLRPLLSA